MWENALVASADLFDRLESARRHAFVGRPDELALFAEMLDGPGGLLFVHGPGGVGKTALLRQFAWSAREAGRPTVWVDARDAGRDTPTLDAWVGELAEPVLLVDTAETLGPLDRWVREDVLARLPAGTVTVIAGRERVPLPWRVDPGWSRLLRIVSLTNLSIREGRELLTRQGVPRSEQSAVLAFTRGHPLALALVMDARAQRGCRLPSVTCPEVVTALLDVLLDAVPGPGHRAALEACALVRVTTEPLLAALVDTADARVLFDWLRELSVIEMGTRGVLPHDLVRDALAAEVRWRHPERHAEIRQRAIGFYRRQMDNADAAAKHSLLVDCAFLYRDDPVIGRVLSALSPSTDGAKGAPPYEYVAVPARSADFPDIRAMAEHHEGPASAELVAHWLKCQPHNAYVVRDPDDNNVGFVQFVALGEVSDLDECTDPAVAAALAYLGRTAMPASLVRSWMSRDSYQEFSPVQTEITLCIIQHSLTTPNLVATLIGCANPDDWDDVAAYTYATRVPPADFTVGGRTVAVYIHDWRLVAPLDWLARVVGLEPAVALSSAAAPSAATAPPPAAAIPAARQPGSGREDTREAFTAEAFADAVRVALRDFCRPDRLCESPLQAARVVEQACDDDSSTGRVRALQHTIRAAAAVLEESPRDRGAFRTLHHTYVQPAGTQRLAAELLGLPTSTYRRYLAAGVEQLVSILWQRECEARQSP